MAQTKKDGMRSPAIHFGAPHPDFHPNSDDLSLFPSKSYAKGRTFYLFP